MVKSCIDGTTIQMANGKRLKFNVSIFISTETVSYIYVLCGIRRSAFMTDNQDKRKYLLTRLETFLKSKGFKKKAFTFKRETENGLLQLIELRLGNSWSSTSGEINLEFGIFSNEWHQFLHQYKTPSTIRTPDCEIRDMYCSIVDRGNNHNWFKLTDNLDDLVLDIINVINKSILPYLDRLKTRKDIMESYRQYEEKMGLPPRHKLSIAVLTYGMGEKERGLQLVHDEYLANKKNPFYVRVFEKMKDEFQKTTA